MRNQNNGKTDVPVLEENNTNYYQGPNITVDEIYEFYRENIVPAVISSLPMLLSRIKMDMKELFRKLMQKSLQFLIPWSHQSLPTPWSSSSIHHVFNQTVWGHGESAQKHFSEFILRHFDKDNDGLISTSEILHLKELPNLMLNNFDYHPPQTWFTWFQRAWPLMDWKLGVFLWKSCSGLMIIIIIATIVPGRLHGISGRLLRWPILGFTYFMITIELLVYVVIRLFIKFAEMVFANHKHRALRYSMSNAVSYSEWYNTAKQLDYSQKRNKWQKTMDDDTSYNYNWSFIHELISDMQLARITNDTTLALAVLQQCTRKNVGGVMSEDLFSYTNTGEPKLIVKKFIEEVVITLVWATKQTKKLDSERFAEDQEVSTVTEDKKEIIKDQKSKSNEEENKLQIVGRVVGWALTVLTGDGDENKEQNMKTEKKLKGNEEDISLVHDSNDSDENDTTAESKTSKQQHANTINREKKEQLKTFLKRARAAYGRTALCLSGGAMMGCYHFGHVRALFEEGILPHIISGTSAGSAIAAMMCTRTDDEIRRDLVPDALVDKMQLFTLRWKERLINFYKSGCLFDGEEILSRIKWFTCGDLTFEEAYRKTGRVLCITLSATTKKAPPVLINYISAPNVVIASAVIASAAAPGLISPRKLQVKGPDGVVRDQVTNKGETYWDGSIDQDIPTTGLSEVLNCQFFLAAQCNPHIVPFFYNSKGDVGRPSRWSSGMRDDSWRGGFLLSALELYLKSDMRAKFHFLNDLEAAVGFTSTLMTQQYRGTTTIVPQVSFKDYFMLFSNPTLDDMYRFFTAGRVAAYQHCAMMKLHYSIGHAIEECLKLVEEDGSSVNKSKRRSISSSQNVKEIDKVTTQQRIKHAVHSLTTVAFADLSNEYKAIKKDENSLTSNSSHDEYEQGGFDGVDVPYSRTKD